MSQKSIEINKNNIPDDVKVEVEYEALLYGDCYVFIGKLKNMEVKDHEQKINKEENA